MLVADRDAKLPRFETKPSAELEEETLHVIEESGFKIVLRISRPIREPGEFEHVGSRMRSSMVAGASAECLRARATTTRLFLERPVRS